MSKVIEEMHDKHKQWFDEAGWFLGQVPGGHIEGNVFPGPCDDDIEFFMYQSGLDL